MDRVQLENHGSFADSLVYRENLERPSPGPREALIKVGAASVNPIDCRVAKGYGWNVFGAANGVTLPITLGRDFCGEVVSTGAEFKGLEAHDKVWGAVNPFRAEGFRNGSHSQYVLVVEEEVAPCPAGPGEVELASMPYVFLTSWGALFTTSGWGPQDLEGKRVLINGAGGGVGTISVQLLKAYGAHVVTTSSRGKVSFLRGLGADETYAYDEDGLPSGLTDIHLVYNLVPAEASQQRCLETLKRAPLSSGEALQVREAAGRSLGRLEGDTTAFTLEDYQGLIRDFDRSVQEITSGKPTYVSIVSPMMRLADQQGFHQGLRNFVSLVLNAKMEQLISRGRCYHYGFFRPDKAALSTLTGLVETGRIGPVVSGRFPLRQAVEAFQQVGSGHTRGKVVLEMS